MTIYDDSSRFGKEAMDTTLKSVSAVTKGFQMIASETTEYTKRSCEQSAQMVEKFSQVRTLDKAVELQSEYARSAYEAWMTQATKLGEIYSDIAKESCKPFEAAFANMPKPATFTAG